MENKHPEFEEIRCFYDEDVPEKLWPLVDQPAIEKFVKALMPNLDMDQFRAQIKSMHTIREFQSKVVAQFVLALAKKTTDSLELRGVENIQPGRAATYITNHRDIVLDSAFLNTMLNQHGLTTAEIAIGDNLFAYDWIKDLVRLNKSFIVLRSVPVRQMLEVSKRLSSYIHYTINEKKNPIWIAQREGRSKDSSDETQASVVKMLAMGGSSRDIIQNIRQLNVQPVALSYEYDPCDYLKAQEFQQKRDQAGFKKSRQDDLDNMRIGIFGYKGRVVYRPAAPINTWIDKLADIPKTEFYKALGERMDKEIHRNYHLYPCNYIALDELNGSTQYASHYTDADRQRFDSYLQGQMAKIKLPEKDEPFLRERMLTMYANPLVNHLAAR
mgnify:CR=1 FL=1